MSEELAVAAITVFSLLLVVGGGGGGGLLGAAVVDAVTVVVMVLLTVGVSTQGGGAYAHVVDGGGQGCRRGARTHCSRVRVRMTVCV